MRKGSFANICEGENNQFEKKMALSAQKKRGAGLFFFILRLSSAEW